MRNKIDDNLRYLYFGERGNGRRYVSGTRDINGKTRVLFTSKFNKAFFFTKLGATTNLDAYSKLSGKDLKVGKAKAELIIQPID